MSFLSIVKLWLHYELCFSHKIIFSKSQRGIILLPDDMGYCRSFQRTYGNHVFILFNVDNKDRKVPKLRMNSSGSQMIIYLVKCAQTLSEVRYECKSYLPSVNGCEGTVPPTFLEYVGCFSFPHPS